MHGRFEAHEYIQEIRQGNSAQVISASESLNKVKFW